MEKIKSYLKSFVESKKFNAFVYGFFIAAVALLIFKAGVFVGFHKANFSYQWGDNYQKFFEMRGRGGKAGVFGGLPKDNFMGAHGVAGKIIDIKLPSIIMTGENNTEKAILLDKDTIIRKQRDSLRPEDLKLGDSLVVVGTPNDNSEIVAKMIRVVPAILEINSATSTN